MEGYRVRFLTVLIGALLAGCYGGREQVYEKQAPPPKPDRTLVQVHVAFSGKCINENTRLDKLALAAKIAESIPTLGLNWLTPNYNAYVQFCDDKSTPLISQRVYGVHPKTDYWFYAVPGPLRVHVISVGLFAGEWDVGRVEIAEKGLQRINVDLTGSGTGSVDCVGLEGATTVAPKETKPTKAAPAQEPTPTHKTIDL